MNKPEEKKTPHPASEDEAPDTRFTLSETWAEDAQDDLDEWIELQGIQLRF